MKRKSLIIASLLVLSLSFVLLGCPPPDEEEEFNPAVPDSVMKILKEDIGYTDTFYTPSDVNYDGYFFNNSNFLAIWWKDGDQAKFDAYKTKWGDKVKTSSINLARTITMDDSAGLTIGDSKIAYTKEGGNQKFADDNIDYNVPANSIYFTIYK